MKQDPSGRIAPNDAAGEPTPRLAALLSALADGETAASEADEACLAWRQGAGCETWHTYQLIGDVLRSEDLVACAGSDAAFLRRMRERLAQEPVVLAPVAETAAVQQSQAVGGGAAVHVSWRRWSAPAAMAAGVLAVAGVAVMVRQGGSGTLSAPATLAAASAAEPSARLALAGGDQAPATQGPAVLVRDPQLDRYLAAHRQYTGRALLVDPQDVRQAMVALPLDR
jgi:sigma-E factor negative regulatory protein RseA